MTRKSLRTLSWLLILVGWSLVFFPVFAAAAPPEVKKAGPSFSIKLSGGAGYALNGGGDLEQARLGRINYYTDLGGEDSYTAILNWKKMSFIPSFGIDLIFYLNPNIGIGLGSGYIMASSKGDYGYTYKYDGSESWGSYTLDSKGSYVRDYKINAIPIVFNLYYKMPMGQMNFYAYAGAGLYIGKLTHDYTVDESLNYQDSSTYFLDEKYEYTYKGNGTEKVKKNALGFNGGFGLEYNLGSNIALGLEVFGRFVNFSGWDGSYSEEWTEREREWLEESGWYNDQTVTGDDKGSGKLWYYESYDSDFGKQYGQMYVWEEKPSGSSYRAVKEAAINLNA
ncbi:MAG: hypothetical protein MUP52_13335, partial [Candidatus Aminicenantes bacterium]|nr:hypothetical protein [Candidatus Aminicenantes bacterium]